MLAQEPLVLSWRVEPLLTAAHRQSLLRAVIADVVRLGIPPKAGLVAAGGRSDWGVGSSQDRF